MTDKKVRKVRRTFCVLLLHGCKSSKEDTFRSLPVLRAADSFPALYLMRLTKSWKSLLGHPQLHKMEEGEIPCSFSKASRVAADSQLRKLKQLQDKLKKSESHILTLQHTVDGYNELAARSRDMTTRLRLEQEEAERTLALAKRAVKSARDIDIAHGRVAAEAMHKKKRAEEEHAQDTVQLAAAEAEYKFWESCAEGNLVRTQLFTEICKRRKLTARVCISQDPVLPPPPSRHEVPSRHSAPRSPGREPPSRKRPYTHGEEYSYSQGRVTFYRKYTK